MKEPEIENGCPGQTGAAAEKDTDKPENASGAGGAQWLSHEETQELLELAYEDTLLEAKVALIRADNPSGELLLIPAEWSRLTRIESGRTPDDRACLRHWLRESRDPRWGLS